MENDGNRRFSDLTTEEAEKVMELYYGGERVDSILERFGLSMRASDLVKAFPPQVHLGAPCARCNAASLHSKRRSRTAKGEPQIYCPHCGHEPWNGHCRCEGCVAERAAEAHRRQEEAQVREQDLADKLHLYIAWCNSAEPFNPADLTIRQRVYLAALIRSRLSDQGLYLNTLAHDGPRLAPTEEMEIEVLRALYKAGIIHLHPGNGIKAFTVEGGEIKSFLLDRVFWTVNEETYGEPFSHAHVAELSSVRVAREEHDESVALWRELAAAECFDFLSFLAGEHQFEIKVGPKTMHVVNELLARFPAAEAFSLISTAVRRAASYYQRGGVYRAQAANSIVGNLERLGLRAIELKWEMTPFRRRVDPSTLSDVLSHQVLGLGERIFTTIPGRVIHSSSAHDDLLPPTEAEAIEGRPTDSLPRLSDSEGEDVF